MLMRRLALASVLLLLLVGGGCERLEQLGCGGADYLAELAESKGPVSRDFAAQQGSFRTVEGSERFRVGDGLKTGAGATAVLKLRPSGQVLVQPDTLLRFQAAPPGQQGSRLDLDIGSIEVEGSGSGFALDTVIGAIRIERGTRVRLRSGDEGERLAVLVGTIQVDRDGKPVDVAPGEELVLDVGGITIDGPQEPAPEASPDAGPPADAGAPPDAGALEEEEVVDPDAPTRAEVTVPAGESAVIHDPRPPTRVRVPFTDCQGPATLEFARGRPFNAARTRGTGAGIVRLKPGRYRYRVRCLEGGKPGPPVANGTIQIKRDPGTRRLPTRAATVSVDADGRRYTLRYQNRLPRVTLSWPVPPVVDRYELELIPERGESRTLKLQKPTHTFRSGEIREGVYRFRFRTPDGRAVANGSLSLDFDNAASTAYLSSPPSRGAMPAPPIKVAGAALNGSSVRVETTSVSIDAQGRFSTSVTPDGAHDAIAVRVSHSASGVHYYLRRLK